MSSLSFPLPRVADRVSPDDINASQLADFSIKPNVAPRPSAVRDFPPGCGPSAGEVAPPPAAAANENPTSKVESDDDDGDAESKDDDIFEEYDEGRMSSPERECDYENEEDLLYEIDDRSEYYYDMSISDEYEEDLMSVNYYEDIYEEDLTETCEDDEGLAEEVITEFLKTRTVVCNSREWAAVDDSACAVCLDDLYEGGRAVGVLNCQHGFHDECIKRLAEEEE